MWGCVCGGEEESVEVGLLLCLVGLFVFLFLLSSSIKGEETAYQLGKTVK